MNVVFGWKPFVNDLRKMYNLWQTVDRRLAQIVRENGRSIRRKATVLEDTSVSTVETAYPYPYAGVWSGIPNWIPGSTVRTVTRKTYTRVWFSGSFRYFILDIGTSQWDTRARAALWGVTPTPELLWSVLPWSWLVDWFANVGDVVSNASSNAVDNLTLEYAYLMKHTVETLQVDISTQHAGVDLPRSWKWPQVDHTYMSSYSTETKLRAVGDYPMLWGSNPSGLSAYQVGVLAALGASRV